MTTLRDQMTQDLQIEGHMVLVAPPNWWLLREIRSFTGKQAWCAIVLSRTFSHSPTPGFSTPPHPRIPPRR